MHLPEGSGAPGGESRELRGVGGGLLISLAITMATFAAKHGGGVISIFTGIWLPIMTYVACDFEHCLANFFFFAAATWSGGKLGALPQVRQRERPAPNHASTPINIPRES